jgi:N-acetylmuramoyl-L-alanine amidase
VLAPTRIAFAAAFASTLALAASPGSAQRLIMIDPGHGGSDPGAVGCGLREAPNALDVSKRLERLLEDAGLRVRLTRSNDSYVSLDGRTTMANSAGADRFVSIHINAHTSSATGTETFMYTSGSANSRDLRDRIQRQMIRAWMLTDRGGKTAGFYVLRYTSMPATLSELGFISRCSPDAELIGDPDARQEAAEAHYIAIMGHLGLDTTLPTDEGTLRGVVYEDTGLGEEDTSVRLAGAQVTIAETGVTAEASAEMAEFSFMLPPDAYTVQVTLEGYEPAERTCTLEGAETVCSVGLVVVAAEVDAGVTPEFPDGGPSGIEGPPPPPTTMDRAAAAGGCSTTSTPASSAAWWLALLGLALLRRRVSSGTGVEETTVARRPLPDPGSLFPRGLSPRKRGRPLRAIAVLAIVVLAGCDHSVDPARRAEALGGALDEPAGGEPAPTSGSEAVGAATVEAFASLADDRIAMHEELGAALLSPDGERVAVTLPGHVGLRIVELATGAEVAISQAERAGWLPVWRDDGRAIAYRAAGQSGSAVPLHATDLSGRPLLPFARAELPHFVEREHGIVRIDARGERTVSRAATGERFTAPVRSPDGAHVVFLGVSTGLYVHRVRDGRTVALGPGAQPAFSADGQWLVFARSADDGHRITASDLYLTYLDHDAYPTGRLTDTPDRLERSPSLDATASRLAYLDESDESLHVAALVLDDSTALDAPARPADPASPHFHRTDAPTHEHPHVPDADPWHVTLGH